MTMNSSESMSIWPLDVCWSDNNELSWDMEKRWRRDMPNEFCVLSLTFARKHILTRTFGSVCASETTANDKKNVTEICIAREGRRIRTAAGHCTTTDDLTRVFISQQLTKSDPDARLRKTRAIAMMQILIHLTCGMKTWCQPGCLLETEHPLHVVQLFNMHNFLNG